MSALENNFNGGQFPSQFLLNRQETVLQPPQQANQPEGVFIYSFMFLFSLILNSKN